MGAPDGGVGEVERRHIRAVGVAPPSRSGRNWQSRDTRAQRSATYEVPTVMFGKLWGAIAAPEMLDGLVPVALQWQPDLVVADAAELAGHIVAAELGCQASRRASDHPAQGPRGVRRPRGRSLWRSRGLEPRPYAGCYDTLYLDSYPPLLQPQPADHIARRQLVRPHRDDGEFDSSSALPFPEGPVGSPLVYVTMGTVFTT